MLLTVQTIGAKLRVQRAEYGGWDVGMSKGVLNARPQVLPSLYLCTLPKLMWQAARCSQRSTFSAALVRKLHCC